MSPRLVSRVLPFLILLSCFASLGCDKEEKKGPPPAPVPEGPRWKVDENLSKQLISVGKECEVDLKKYAVKCSDARDKTLVRELVSDKYKRTKSLDTFVSLLEGSDEKVKVAAATVLYESTRGAFEANAAPGSVSTEVAGALLKILMEAPPQMARLVAPAATHAAALAGELDKLYAALDGKTSEAAAAYRFVMVYGRLEAFSQVKELAKSGQSGVRLAALEAPRNMRRWTPKDRAAICPWALELLGDKRPMVGARAATLLSRCSGDYVDKLLESGELALEEGRFTRGELPPYRDLCSGMRKREGGAATKEQCERNRKLLVKVLEKKELDEQTRALALSAIAYQWPDKESHSLAERYSKATKESALKIQASRTEARLKSRLDAEKTTGPGAENLPKIEGLAAPQATPDE